MRMKLVAGLAGLSVMAAPAAFAENFYWTMYFGQKSAVVDAKARAIIDKGIPQMKKCAHNGVLVTGHTDLSFTMQESSELAIARAKAVRDYLLTKGFTTGQIAPQSKSHADPAVPTKEGVKEPKNNRVVIRVVCD